MPPIPGLPILSSTPITTQDQSPSVIQPTVVATPSLPSTQSFNERLGHLRNVDDLRGRNSQPPAADARRGAKAQPPADLPRFCQCVANDSEVRDDEDEIDTIAILDENQALKSEVTARRLLLEDAKEEINRLQQQQQLYQYRN